MPALVLGPIVRYVDPEVATVWMQTDAACDVEILGRRERTWCIDGLHFALVAIDGLAPGIDHPYEVALDGNEVWPPADSAFPPSTIRLPTGDAESRMIFGSCRVALPHEPPYVLRAHEHSDGQGIDALRAYALRAAREGGAAVLPDMLLMLGDQIYADEPSPALQAVIADRSRPDDVPDDEVADFGEYALAYHEAWSEPVIRWLLSTVPTTMIFDDHEIHAEWRISQGWMDEMTAKSWFHRHIRAGLMAYWVFQHLGNLAPSDLDRSELYREVQAAEDGGAALAAQMEDAGRQTGHSRWSFARRIGETQLVVIDSRAGRDVTPGRRALVQDEEWEWIAAQARQPARHLVLASSVPFLLAPGLHYIEAWDEALTDGAWGRPMSGVGERLRRLAVMDHWASFQRSMRRTCELIDDIARGREGDAPESIVLLSGDVHHCYLAQVGFPAGSGAHSAVWQAVCSAFRKELAPHEKAILKFGHTPLAERLSRRLARAAGVRPLPFGWRIVDRPDYANQIGTLTIAGPTSHVSVEAVVDTAWRDPHLQTAFDRRLTA